MPLVYAAGLLVGACCTRGEPPGAGITPASNSAIAAASERESAASASTASSATPPVASSSNSVTVAASADAPEAVDPDNKTLPASASPELDRSARALFEAIATDDPSKAHAFFFPREPFTPLKDVADADRYWQNLYRTYERDIHQLHGKRRSWTEVSYEGFELGSTPTWVKPGDEYNKIGYHRTFGARLLLRVDGQRYTVKVHTLISWNGRWTITHLLPFKKRQPERK